MRWGSPRPLPIASCSSTRARSSRSDRRRRSSRTRRMSAPGHSSTRSST
ncbi:uncharacterized protein METZ01_LOCUS62843, partial [marine metagenome]